MLILSFITDNHSVWFTGGLLTSLIGTFIRESYDEHGPGFNKYDIYAWFPQQILVSLVVGKVLL